jgi:hypothetical protein
MGYAVGSVPGTAATMATSKAAIKRVNSMLYEVGRGYYECCWPVQDGCPLLIEETRGVDR